MAPMSGNGNGAAEQSIQELYDTLLNAKTNDEQHMALGKMIVSVANFHNKTDAEFRKHKMKCGIYFSGIFALITGLFASIGVIWQVLAG